MFAFRHTVLALGFCGGLIAATAVFAVDAPMGGTPVTGQAQQPMPEGIKADKLPKPNANPMNLNPAQQKELAALRQEHVEHLQKIGALERQLQDITASDTFDKGKVQAIAEQIAAATKEYLAAHAKRTNTFYASLSPEQKKQFKAFEERRRKIQDRMMMGGHPMRPGQQPGRPAQPQGSNPDSQL